MNSKQNVADTLVAINSVKRRAKGAFDQGNIKLYAKLMADLSALEVVLVGLSQTLVDDLDNAAAQAIIEKDAA